MYTCCRGKSAIDRGSGGTELAVEVLVMVDLVAICGGLRVQSVVLAVMVVERALAVVVLVVAGGGNGGDITNAQAVKRALAVALEMVSDTTSQQWYP